MSDLQTASLKSFATWARTALIGEVSARISAVLAPGSTERVEEARSVAALEKAVSMSGGADEGRAAVTDRVAYTWFNRIVALRFMDANGYTGIGVVSPQADIGVGQPEILAEAKRGVFHTGVVGETARMMVTSLLDGTRASGDSQGEAYALLLAEYCRFWNRAMPFMFEREGDYTELLVPANLLADGSVLARSLEVLTKEACKDVEVIGWLYQFYISERKDEVFLGFKNNEKAGAGEIPAATQLFTPHWIVRYLVENSVGRLWMLNHPSSGLIDRMDYYVEPTGEETDLLKIARPEELTVIDPACGSGHMLAYAFDLLYVIYEEEGYSPAEIPRLILTHNLYGTEIDPRAGALAAFALTMKARAKQRTIFQKQVEPNISVIEPVRFTSDELGFLVASADDPDEDMTFWNQFAEADLLGSLIRADHIVTARVAQHLESLDDNGDMLKAEIKERARRVAAQAEYLSPSYGAVVVNPPYMGSRNMQPLLKVQLDHRFPEGKSDLYAAFLARGLDLTASGGVLAMITMQSWMFLKSYERLRATMLSLGRISSMLHLGTRAFDAIGGDVVSTTAFTWVKGRSDVRGVFVRLVDLDSELTKSQKAMEAIRAGSEHPRLYLGSGKDFRHFAGNIFAYWLPESRRNLFVEGKALHYFADARKGLDTGNNGRFLRYWWEVGASQSSYDSSDIESAKATRVRWFPYNKGGESRKWYGNHWFVVNWAEDGAEIRSFGTESGGKPRSAVRNSSYYFRPSVSWSDVGGLAFRVYPRGFIHDNKGPSIFSGSPSTVASLLGYLNSPLASELLSAIAPTMSTQIGDVAVLPVKECDGLEEVTSGLVETARSDWDSFEVSWSFGSHPLVDMHSGGRLSDTASDHLSRWRQLSLEQRYLETRCNEIVASRYGVSGKIATEVALERVSLARNAEFAFGAGRTEEGYWKHSTNELVKELLSYGIGCMFGRYSLDAPGLILADQGATLQDYLGKVPAPTFIPDVDNVIPIVGGDWFEDDIVGRFREFLRAAFGEEHFEENLRFVTESLGVTNLREYFVKSFYKDHVQRYKKRPIYWMFSSPKGSFNALIYMHRYTPSTVSTVLNEYLREFQAKLKAALEHAERSNNAKEIDRLRKVLLELDEYEHDVLYPLASQNIVIDLDDGVKTNYSKFGTALKRIPGLSA